MCRRTRQNARGGRRTDAAANGQLPCHAVGGEGVTAPGQEGLRQRRVHAVPQHVLDVLALAPRLKGEVTHAISKYREYIRTINPEADRIALYPGGKTYRPHSLFNLSPETTVQHVAELQKYIVQDNVVYLPADSSTYRNLNFFVYGEGISLEKYIEKLGFAVDRKSVV